MPLSLATDPFDPEAVLAKHGTGKTKTYRKNQAIFEQGDVADTIFYIRVGRIKIEVMSSQGRGAVVGILGSGHFFGEACLNGQQTRMATTRALEESAVIPIDKRAMVAMLEAEPGISGLFIASLLMKNVRIEADLVDHLSNSSQKRLARQLLLLANVADGSTTIDPVISQGTLAEMVGTTRPRVNFFMNKFRKLGAIRYDRYGRIEVNNALLQSVLQEESPSTE